MFIRQTINGFGSALLALALIGSNGLHAELITQIVEFSTAAGSLQNQFAINGTLDTLAQGLNVVPIGNTVVGIEGNLRARLTVESSPQGTVDLVGVEFLDNSFEQEGVTLFYDVPGTSRRITFNASDVAFTMAFSNIGGQPPVNLALLSSGPSYQMVQDAGMAQVSITNRPPKQQNLSQQNVASLYDGQSPAPQLGFNNFSILPPTDGGDEYSVAFTLPMANQQLQYAGVGLPVSLDYSGTLQLVGPLSIVIPQVPEPATVALAAGGLMLLLMRRRSCGWPL